MQESLGIDRWRELVRGHEQSGLSGREFAEKHGVTATALAYWRRRLAKEAVASSSSALAISFLEVRPQSPPTIARYEVALTNGRTVTVTAAFEADVLARLLDVVEGGA